MTRGAVTARHATPPEPEVPFGVLVGNALRELAAGLRRPGALALTAWLPARQAVDRAFGRAPAKPTAVGVSVDGQTGEAEPVVVP